MVRDRSNQSSGSLEDVTVITHAIYSWSVRNKLSTTLYAKGCTQANIKQDSVAVK